MHATEFLKGPAKHEIGPVAVLSGPDRFLKQKALQAIVRVVLGEDADNLGVARFSGEENDLRSVLDELRTVSMFGDRRVVVVEDADGFVSQHRAGLETFLKAPAKNSLLILDVKSWPKNTRLAKSAAKIGLALECTELKGAALLRWLSDVCRDQHDKQLSRQTAELLVELVGNTLGMLEQELAKLASFVGTRRRIDAEDVQSLVGGWHAETAFAMIGALQEGRLGEALSHLDRLLTAGEAPQKILGGIHYACRKLARATELSRQGTPLRVALQESGVFPRDMDRSESYLRRIGRPEAERIYDRLLQADADMKGASRLSKRTQLERLLVELRPP